MPIPKQAKIGLSDKNVPKEEDLTSYGITEEEAEKIIVERIPANIISNSDNQDWKEKQKSFQELLNWINQNQPSIDSISKHLMLWLKIKLKDFKESNQNILKEAFGVMQAIISFSNIGKQFANIAVPGLLEKAADTKWKETCINLILLISDSSGPSHTVQIIVCQLKRFIKNVILAKTGLNVLEMIVDEYPISILPVKMIIDCAKLCMENPNQNVRVAANALICALYSYVGNGIKSLLVGTKDAKLKALETEFAKVILKNANETNDNKRKLKGEAASLQLNSKPISDQLFPRVNISSQITSQILSGLSDKGMKVRQESKEQIEKILAEANNRIQANGLGPLIGALKGRMSEPCKSLAKGFISLVGDLALAIGQGCKQYTKTIVPPLLSNFADKQNYIRSETLISINKFAEACGIDSIFAYAGPLLEKDNPEMRTELLNWTLKNKEAIKKTESMLFVTGLTNCLQDRSKEVRTLAEQLLEFILPQVGFQAFATSIQDLKPTVKQSISNLLKKYSCINEACTSPSNEEVKIQKSYDTQKDSKSTLTEDSKTETDFSTAAKAVHFRENVRLIKESPCKSNCSSSSNPMINTIIEPIIINISCGKEKRAEADKNIKWIPDEVMPENLEKLKKQLHSIVHPTLFEMMFSNKLKSQLESIRIFTEAIKSETEFSSITDILDLLFKWILVLMLDQSNSATTKSILELLKALFAKLEEKKHQLMEFEAAVIIPLLAERSGTLNVNFKDDIKELIKNLCSIHPPGKVCNFLVRALDSKHQKTKVECLIMLQELFVKYGMKVIGARDIKAFGKILACSLTSKQDPAIKTESLALLGEIYKQKSEAIWNTFGEISEKVRETLEKKFKQIDIDNPRVKEVVAEQPKSVQENTNIQTNVKINKTELDISLVQIDPNLKKEEPASQKKKIGSIEDCIQFLQTGNMPEQVDALFYLNEKLTISLDEIKKTIGENVDKLFITFANMQKDIFGKSDKEIPIKFAKYFLNISCKLCSIRGIVVNASNEAMTEIMEQLLTNLLYPGLDKIGEEKEGELISRSLNSSMLNLIDKCNPTRVFNVLFKLYLKSKQKECNTKLPELIVKCILKLAKIMDSLLMSIDISELLVCIHEFVCSPTQLPQDDTGIRAVKTVLNELVKMKKEGIWEYYQAIEKLGTEDIYIKRWISLMLQSQNPSVAPVQKANESAVENRESSLRSSDELKLIFEGLNSQSTFQQSIIKLRAYKEQHPDCDLSKYFNSCSKAFANHVLSEVNTCPGQSILGKEYSSNHMVAEKKSNTSLVVNSEDNKSSCIPNYMAKMAELKEKLNKAGIKTDTDNTKLKGRVRSTTTCSKGIPSNFYNTIEQIKAALKQNQ